MTTAHVHRRRVALRLLIVEAGLLTGILAVFALVSFWLAGRTSSVVIIVLGIGFILALLVGDWVLVRLRWKRHARENGEGDGSG